MPVPAWPIEAQGALRAYFAARWGHVVYPWNLPLSSVYGWRRNPDPKTRPAQPVTWHSGIDIPLPKGTPVIAIWEGIIQKTEKGGPDSWNGNAVFLRCGPWQLAYLHLDTIRVSAGDRVVQGQILGTVGNTGHSFGNHLHFQATIGGRTVDPSILFPGTLFYRR